MWTSQLPIIDGFYRVCLYGSITKVYVLSGRVYFTDDGSRPLAELDGAMWSGPLEDAAHA